MAGDIDGVSRCYRHLGMAHNLSCSGSGLYDEGFSERVFNSHDFDYYTEYLRTGEEMKVKWSCNDGDAELLIKAMRANLKMSRTDEQIKNKSVTTVALQRHGRTLGHDLPTYRVFGVSVST